MNGRLERVLLSLTAVFVFINAVSLSLVRDGRLAPTHFLGPGIWFILFFVAHFLLGRYRHRRDPYLLPIVALLSGWGLVLIDRLAPNFLMRQIVWLVLGAIVLLSIAILPRNLDWLRRYRYTLLVGGLLLLAGTLLFGVNPSGVGDALWLPLPFPVRVFFQPSELLKLLLVIFLASYFDQREPFLQLVRSSGRFAVFPLIAPLLIMWGLCILFLVWQQDLGAATLFFILFLAILYLATGQWEFVWGGLALLLIAGTFGYVVFDRVGLRVNAWLNPWPDAQDQAYQIVQSLYAVANGGVLGQGVAQGFPDYIPVVHSDFAFAAIAEEWGLIGSLTLVAGFALLAYRGFRLAAQATRPFQLYLAAGISILFSAQALLIMGGATRLLPLTGVTLPFVSYGGSSLLVSCVMIGLLIFQSGAKKSALAPALPAQTRLPMVMGLILVGFSAIALVLGYWSIGRAPTILAREDNPRLVEADLRILRGRIFDRNNLVLADTVGPPDQLVRRYPLTAVGPAIGYYSFRHGTSGIEESLNAILRGDSPSEWEEFTRELLHQRQIGRDIRLTLDAGWQIQAEELLNEHRGAIVALELAENGRANILAIVSHPSYDPNRLDDNFDDLTADEEAPLLNRATQGQYQPGLVLQPFLLAAALNDGTIALADTAPSINGPVVVNGRTRQCLFPPNGATWKDALNGRCPAPMLILGRDLGQSGLETRFEQFGLTTLPADLLSIDLPELEPLADTDMAAIGQENLLVSPMQIARAWTALAQDGRLPTLDLVTAAQDEWGEWQAISLPPPAEGVISPDAAQAILSAMPEQAGVHYFSTAVLSGPEGETNSWFMGVAPQNQPRYVVVVLLESVADTAVAEQMGFRLLASGN